MWDSIVGCTLSKTAANLREIQLSYKRAEPVFQMPISTVGCGLYVTAHCFPESVVNVQKFLLRPLSMISSFIGCFENLTLGLLSRLQLLYMRDAVQSRRAHGPMRKMPRLVSFRPLVWSNMPVPFCRFKFSSKSLYERVPFPSMETGWLGESSLSCGMGKLVFAISFDRLLLLPTNVTHDNGKARRSSGLESSNPLEANGFLLETTG
jgi:hypothetical protein